MNQIVKYFWFVSAAVMALNVLIFRRRLLVLVDHGNVAGDTRGAAGIHGRSREYGEALAARDRRDVLGTRVRPLERRRHARTRGTHTRSSGPATAPGLIAAPACRCEP